MAYLLPQLLTHSARRAPDDEALRFEGRSLSYAQLDAATNQLARALRRAGVERGDRVAIWLRKSPASVLSVFGILKAGAVYVPLDPTAPLSRLAGIVADCGVRALLTSADRLEGAATLCQDPTLTTVVLTDDHLRAPPPPLPAGVRMVPWAEVLAEAATPVPTDGYTETDLAYILYTSGSTGDPKGVMIAHRTVLTFIDWCAATFGVSRHDRVTSHAPLHFDLSTFDLYVTLMAGGTVVLVPEELSLFPERLADLLQDERITITYLVPSVLSLLATFGKLRAHDLGALRAILFAGEVFPIKYLRQVAASVPRAAYYNLYGPTETNVCMYHRVRRSDLEREPPRPVPIGRACENMEVLALDDAGRPVTTPGQEAELWVRGPGVALGYWGDPRRTAERFVRNPLQPHFAETAYRTGDIATLDDDGVHWRYVGRRDSMVKSRGYRIELGDVEAALYEHPQVKEAAVVAMPDELIGSRLRAVVVPLEEGAVSAGELQRHCLARLPRYMVPERIQLAAALPKTSSGKVDRVRLARQSEGTQAASSEQEAHVER